MQSVKKIHLSNQMLMAVLAVVSLMVFAVCFIAGKSFVSKMTFNNLVISKKTIAKKQLEKNLASIPDLKRNYAAMETKSDQVLRSLPIKTDFTGLASSLETIAGTSGVVLNSVNLGSVGQVAEDAPIPFGFTVSVNGNYANLLQFLQNIELSARPMKVESVNFSGSTNDVAATVVMSSYFQAAADLNLKTETITK